MKKMFADQAKEMEAEERRRAALPPLPLPPPKPVVEDEPTITLPDSYRYISKESIVKIQALMRQQMQDLERQIIEIKRQQMELAEQATFAGSAL